MDPGTALAVVGMGGSVCKSLYQYYRLWKNCDDDITELRISLLWLDSVFEEVAKVLQSCNVPHASRLVTLEAVYACDKSLQKLRSKLDKIKQDSTPTTALERLKENGRRACYPFRAGTVEKLLVIINSCKHDMHLAIQLLGIHIGATMNDQLNEMDSKLTSKLDCIHDGMGTLALTNDILTSNVHDQNRTKVFDWLAPMDPSSLPPMQPEHGTNHWFLTGHVFEEWITKPASLLCLYGPVGCGKSILCSSIVKHLQSPSSWNVNGTSIPAVAFFHFSFNEKARHDVNNMIRCLIAQLCPNIGVPPHLQTLYDKHHDSFLPTKPTYQDLLETLTSMIKDQSLSKTKVGPELGFSQSTFIIIDGLDEIPLGVARDSVMTLLQTLAGLRLEHLHLLVINRPESDLKLGLRSPIQWDFVALDLIEINRDINTYVSRELERHPRLLTLPKDTKTLISARLCYGENSMFRWVVLQLEALKRLKLMTPKAVERTLDNLPKDLDETYERMLAEIDGLYFEEVYEVLQWLSLSYRPLFIEELVEISAISLNSYPPFEEERRLQASDLRSLLANLVRVEPEYDELAGDPLPGVHRVILSHSSVKDYLKNGHNSNNAQLYLLDIMSSQKTIASSCLAYLYCTNSVEKRSAVYPLRPYAWDYWAFHAVSDSDVQLISNLEIEKKAIRLFNLITYGKYGNDLTDQMFASTQSDFSTISAWIQEDKRSALKAALRTPFFYEEYDGHEVLDKFCYTNTLLREGRFIRLIELFPSDHSWQEIRCRMITESLDNEPQYEAMSYTWGQYRDQFPIRVNGLPFYANSSVSVNLRLLRGAHSKQVRRLWVDALCINMWNYEEKASQVRLMGEIYKQATEVAVMMNEGPHARALNVLRAADAVLFAPTQDDTRAASIRLRECLTFPLEFDPYEAIEQLFTGAWWTRAWTLAEGALASKATIYFGDLPLDLDMVGRLAENSAAFQGVLEISEQHHGASSNTLFSSESWRRVCERSTVRRLHSAKQLNLPYLLWLTRQQHATYAGDRFISLMSLLSNEDLIAFDYREPHRGLCIAVSKLLITKYKNLDALSYISPAFRSLEATEEVELPSWASDHKFSNQDSKPLVEGLFGGPDAHDPFNANGRLLADPEFSTDQGILSLLGILVGTVIGFAEPSAMLLGRDHSSYIRGRCTFSTNTGHEGLGPRYTKVGDVVVVLAGGRVPFICRELNHQRYILVGECLVLGIMNGEVVDAAARGFGLFQRFDFV